ncbi:GmrSD restriction endonuclease domain-containing protein [Flavobacterium litorale]|uniref:DUF262 domain-containing protein n=1 Tax=Flavobacterium litorale TaxID=2856519 RepID=A0ABX8V7G7_9FLAO|nr:DUF262 domain-containing protein [Flavobacterium litorale]QYJ68793.1 DUF262 domain-containing protein [Flavobacterium litorale]
MSYNIQRTTFKVADFVSWFNSKGLLLNPDFQRRSVWNDKSKSYLIDTILRGLPIPVIILRDVKTDLDSFMPVKEVVDGQQRLRTVISYALGVFDKDNKAFKLSKTHNETYGGKTFKELPDEAKQEILDYEFFVHVLPSTVSNREILEIFSRMNSTGVKLNDQELRNASFYGEFKSLAFKIGNKYYDYWIRWGVFTDSKISRMEEVEFVNDLLMLSIDGTVRRTPESINAYYKKYDDEGSIPESKIKTQRLENIFMFLDEAYGKNFKDSPFKKTPLLYSLFSVIYQNEFSGKPTKNVKINISKKSLKNSLDRLSEEIKKAQKEWKKDRKVTSLPEKVYDAFTRGTNSKENREEVFKFLNKELY